MESGIWIYVKKKMALKICFLEVIFFWGWDELLGNFQK